MDQFLYQLFEVFKKKLDYLKNMHEMNFIKVNTIKVQGNVITYHKNVLVLGHYELSIQALHGIQIPFMHALVWRYYT
jgi:hypothetical protein